MYGIVDFSVREKRIDFRGRFAAEARRIAESVWE